MHDALRRHARSSSRRAVAGGGRCSASLQLPPMLGYLVVGVVDRPARAGARPRHRRRQRYLARVRRGVPDVRRSASSSACRKLHSMRSIVFGLGFGQVVLTIALAAIAALGRARHGVAPGASAGRARVALGGALAMSSTAIVVKLLAERLRARERARPPRDGRAAVPGSRRGAAAGADPGARLVARGADRDGAGHRARQGGGGAGACCSSAASA